MEDVKKVAKVKVMDILDVYPDGQYLARVEEIVTGIDQPIFEVTKDTEGFLLENGTLINAGTIKAGTKVKLIGCNLDQYLSPFRYTAMDADGNNAEYMIYLTDTNLKHISGNLGTKVTEEQ